MASSRPRTPPFPTEDIALLDKQPLQEEEDVIIKDDREIARSNSNSATSDDAVSEEDGEDDFTQLQRRLSNSETEKADNKYRFRDSVVSDASAATITPDNVDGIVKPAYAPLLTTESYHDDDHGATTDPDELLDGVAKCEEHIKDIPQSSARFTGVNENVDDETHTVRMRPVSLSLGSMKKARLSQMIENTSDSDSSSEDEFGAIYAAKTVSRMTPKVAQQTSVISTRSQQDETTISVRDLSSILNSDVLSSVKSHLRSVRTDTRRQSSQMTVPVVQELNPAAEWELKKKKVNLNKMQAGRIKAGWKVRQYLANLPEGDTIETFFLQCVKNGMERELHALMALGKTNPDFKFDKNFRNEHNKSALRLALDRENVSMIKTLLEYKLELGDCLFHAIKRNYLEGVKAILDYNPSEHAKIVGENYYFQPGVTPMILAARNNNYRILSILHEHGHQLADIPDWVDSIQHAWESSNERCMICTARSSPAYITLMQEKYHMDPFGYCLQEIGRIKKFRKLEHEFSDIYKDIETKLEQYMCHLLDQVQSSEELAGLFHYNYVPMKKKDPSFFAPMMDGTAARWEIGNRLLLLEKASGQGLINFVTHQQSQLALSYLRYRSVPYMRTQSPIMRNLTTMLIGSLFPILSLLYVIAPRSKIGSLITLPLISFSCHMMSDLYFAALLMINILNKQAEFDYLGSPPTIVQILIMVWVVGKWIQEAQECLNRGPKHYFSDYWNYNDIIQLLLFSTSIMLRLVDYTVNGHMHEVGHPHLMRSEWNAFEPRLLAEAIQAFAYVFVFLRILGIARGDRMLGPLQISLARMMSDIMRFLCIFALVIVSFAFGLSELYWYYGTENGKAMFCKKSLNSTGNSTDSNSTVTSSGSLSKCESEVSTIYTTPFRAIRDLFWALFGYIELSNLDLGGKHMFTEYVGILLTAIYHVVAIIVMLNMLIAMMSNSYERTSSNEETEWKFHRTSMWIRYIRREVIRPPPMNLFPNPYRLRENFTRFRNFLRTQCGCCYGDTCECIEKKRRNSKRDKNRKRRTRLGSDLESGFSYEQEINETKLMLMDGICCGIGKRKRNKEQLPRSRLISEASSVEKQHKYPRSAMVSVAHSRRSSFSEQGSPKNGKMMTNAVRKEIQAVMRLNLKKEGLKYLMSKFVRRYKYKYLIDPQAH